MDIKHSVLLSLGSNLGDRFLYLTEAAVYIAHWATLVQSSKVYETAPWNGMNQPHYLNQVLLIQTTLSPDDVLKQCLNIEAKLGRQRQERWASRTIDIDLLFYDDLVINTPQLTLPHPHIQDRLFVLQPLVDMGMGDMIHPIYTCTIGSLLQHFEGDNNIHVYTP